MPTPARDVRTIKDAGLLIVDYDAALGAANSQIAGIRRIVQPPD